MYGLGNSDRDWSWNRVALMRQQAIEDIRIDGQMRIRVEDDIDVG